MKFAWTLLLVTSLSSIGCRKPPPPEPIVEPAPQPEPEKPKLEVAFQDARFAGMHTGNATGILTLPVSMTNNADIGIDIKTVEVGVYGGEEERVCSVKSSDANKLAPNSTTNLPMKLECAYETLGTNARTLFIRGTVIFELGGERRNKRVRGRVKLLN